MSDVQTPEEKQDTSPASTAGNNSNIDNSVAPPSLSAASSTTVPANFPLQGPNDQAQRKVIVAPDNGGHNDEGNDTTRKLTGILGHAC